MKQSQKYYKICTPTNENQHTGNYCVKFEQVVKNDKDFIFNQIVNGKLYTKIISREYIANHISWIYKKNIDSATGEVIGKTYFPIITLEDILAA